MKIRLAILLSSILIVFSCNTQKKTNLSFFNEIKKLSYSRDPNVTHWKALYKQLNSIDDKYQLVLSAGQTKIRTLFPFLKSVFVRSHDDSLKVLSIFSMAQTDPLASTAFFLQNLASDSLSTRVQEMMIKTLGQCGDARSLPFLEKATQQTIFSNKAFYALGLLAKRGIADSAFLRLQFDSLHINTPSPGKAFYLYFSDLNGVQMNRLLHWLPEAHEPSRILLLKKLAKFLNSNRSSAILADSTNRQVLRYYLTNELNTHSHSWHVLLPELKIARYFTDSLFFQLVQKHTNDSLPSLRIQAFKSLVAMDPQRALPLLIAHFSQLSYTSEKALICQLIARIDPSTGYLLINQNLDKGNPFFRKILLSALAETKFPLAIRMLRQFLTIDNPLLIQGAYDALKSSHYLQESDVRNLLKNPYYSVVAMALSDWDVHYQPPDKSLLLQLFKTFHRADQFELQLEVASMLKKAGDLSVAEKDTIRNYLAHPYVARRIFKMLDIPYKPEPIPLSILPVFLQPDSLQLSDHPKVKIITSKGSFQMVLFPEFAPLTVKNFLHLAKIKFYNHLFFHRVVQDFVVQGGDPSGTGWGGARYLIPSEHSPLSFVRGSVGVATAGFDTGSSQFFICLSDQPHLDGHYTLFAQVISGMQTVDKLEQGDLILNIKRIH